LHWRLFLPSSVTISQDFTVSVVVTERVGLGLGPSFSGFLDRFTFAHRLLGFEMDSM
jgi:hypothetical protein